MTHRDGRDSETASDLGLGEARAEPSEPSQPAFFESSSVTMALGLASPAQRERASRIITYLRKGQ